MRASPSRTHRPTPWLALSMTLLASLPHAALAADRCQTTTPRALVERVMSADCEHCWSQAEPPRPATAMVLDWIAPATDDAPMQIAALAESLARAGTVRPAETVTRTTVLDTPGRLRLVVQDGPPWNGYIGLQLTVQRRGPLAGEALVGYLGLVERVPAGEEGSPVARQLMRVVTGPMLLDDLATRSAVSRLVSVRVPEGSRPERLVGVGWVEAAGQVRLAGEARSPACGIP